MKKLFMSQFAIGAMAVLVWSLLGTVPASQAATVNFISTDEPGPWFKCVSGPPLCVAAGTESLAIVPPNSVVKITNGTETNSTHTFTSLLFPTGAKEMPFDQNEAFKGSRSVNLKDTGLYVFVCKLHPFMLAAVIVDDPATKDTISPTPGGPAFDLGDKVNGEITLINGITVPTTSNLAARLLRAFFLITDPAKYQDLSTGTWGLSLPPVIVQLNPLTQVSLSLLDLPSAPLPSLSPPASPGIGEVWIDTQYEKTGGKSKPGTATAVNVAAKVNSTDPEPWTVTKKVALPQINMNNPHNMWTDKDQTVIYQTQWFDTKLTVFRRDNGALERNINVGQAPAHVMTRVDTDQVHVSINGGDDIVELSKFADGNGIDRRIPTQFPGEKAAQPHAHWMSFDGHTMVTPNSNTADSTRINLLTGTIQDKQATGTLPIATGMMPDASKYYVSNYLDSTITCITISTNTLLSCKADNGASVPKKTINLLLGGDNADPNGLANYDPISGKCGPVNNRVPCENIGALPIQTPVSPNGKYVVTANTLSGTITIIDTATDKLVKVLLCSAGCHGVNFGAKDDPINGGYYAYVSSKFSNDLIIVDLDSNNSGNISGVNVVGRVVLVADPGLQHAPLNGTVIDDSPTQYLGMGGQGVLPIPLVYNGWVQKLPSDWCAKLSVGQRSPFGPSPAACTP